MPEVDVPVVGTEIDTSDPSGTAMSVAMGVAGIGALAVMVNYGEQIGSWATSQIDGVTGANASGNNPFNFRGDL